MNFINKLERKFGKYAISNLSIYLIICYAAGYLISMINPSILMYLTLNPYLIIRGQIWRLVTWLLVPPAQFSIWTLITLYFYYSIGTSLERTWGTFYYNLYIFMGMLFTAIGAFIIMGIAFIFPDKTIGVYGAETYFNAASLMYSTYYISMSIFLGFAATYPNVQVLLMFILPIKVKWLGFAYGAIIAYDFFMSGFVGKIVIFASLLNFIVFFAITRRNFMVHMSPTEVKRRHDFQREVKKAKTVNNARHKCAICGRTSDEYPELEYRFCSKCNGNYEYCQDHLFTHNHVK